MILLQTLPFFPFQGAPQETPKQISKLPAKTGWRLLQSKSNAVIFTGELPQDIVGSMRVGRREKGEAGKLDSAQHPPSGMLLFLLPDQGRQDAGHWLPAAPCEPLCPRWARHAAVSTTFPDLWERSTAPDRPALCRGPSAMATVFGGTHHLWELRSMVHNRILRKICCFHLSSHKRQ